MTSLIVDSLIDTECVYPKRNVRFIAMHVAARLERVKDIRGNKHSASANSSMMLFRDVTPYIGKHKVD
jgi:hypothetical protein